MTPPYGRVCNRGAAGFTLNLIADAKREAPAAVPGNERLFARALHGAQAQAISQLNVGGGNLLSGSEKLGARDEGSLDMHCLNL